MASTNLPYVPGVQVIDVPPSPGPITGVGTSTAAFIGDTGKTLALTPQLITSYTQFQSKFKLDVTKEYQGYLADAVLGFFGNGGTSCYIVHANTDGTSQTLDEALTALLPYDDIAIVAAPGWADSGTWQSLQQHVENDSQNRFAILDYPPDGGQGTSDSAPPSTPPPSTPPPSTPAPVVLAANDSPPEIPASDSVAAYYPWFDVAVPGSPPTTRSVPPSGAIAGIYARVDAQRGVFKAPANEPVYGAITLSELIDDNRQNELAQKGVNCIRKLNGNILVWGARTAKSDSAFKYVSTRRTYDYIRASLAAGTQWAVFEPNNPMLWGKIVRNVSSFLRRLWEAGGLFGDTPSQAYFVKCDEETNPIDVRQQGQVVTQVGVALTQPAEFVVFQLGVVDDDGSADASS